MMRIVSLAVALVFVASPPSRAAEPPEVALNKDARNTALVVKDLTDEFRSVRIVRDLAKFDISKLDTRKAGAWVVAKIQPGGLSGTLHNQGVFIQAETGKVIDSGIRPHHVILVGGQWELVDLLGGQAPSRGRFEWKAPYRNTDFDRNVDFYDQYSVFTDPNNVGTVICQLFPGRKGAAQFSSVTAIPDNWKSHVKPAHEYHVQHAADMARADLNELRKLALADNPFIGLLAIRAILLKDEDPVKLIGLVRALPKYRQAVLTFRLLQRKDGHTRELILKAVDETKNTPELSGMALGMKASPRRIPSRNVR